MDSVAVIQATRKGICMQIGLCVVASLGSTGIGFTHTFSGVALPYMMKPGGVLFINPEQASWIASISYLTIMTGHLTTGPLVDRYGRRLGILLPHILFVVGWLLVAIEPNLTRVYVGRLLTGFASGSLALASNVYLTEIATPEWRGVLTMARVIFASLGVCIMCLMGWILQDKWQLIAYICAAFPVVTGTLAVLCLPESHVWLMSKGRGKEAAETLCQLRGAMCTQQVEPELEHLAVKSRNRKTTSSLRDTLAQLRYREVHVPLAIMSLLCVIRAQAGVQVVLAYLIDIVKSVGVAGDPYKVVMLVAVLRLVSSMSGTCATKILGKRFLMLSSGGIMAVCMGYLGMNISTAAQESNTDKHFMTGFNTTLLDRRNYSHGTLTKGMMPAFDGNVTVIKPVSRIAEEQSDTLSICTFLIFVLMSSIFVALPTTMVSEVFPTHVRGVASGFCNFLLQLSNFVAVKLYPWFTSVLQSGGVFYVFAGAALCHTFFVALFLPETRNKSLAEIEKGFASGKRSTRLEQDKLAKPLEHPPTITPVIVPRSKKPIDGTSS